MKDKLFLMIPGPTPVPESVLQAMAKHPIGHRSSEFSKILKEVYSDLKWFFQTQNDVFLFTASGTGAMDAALSNILNPGDKVLSLVMGNFSERWVKIAKSRGAEVETIDAEWGKAIDPEAVRAKLAADTNKEIKVVTVTHNETSTGVLNDVKTICEIIHEHGALSVVDGVTSVGAVPVKPDEWGIDILVSGSQKGFMVPAGLSFLSCSDRAFEAYKNCKYPSFYFNFGAYKKSVADDSTPFTPNINMVFALHKAFEILKAEGLDAIYARHEKITKGIRTAVKALGLKLLVEDDSVASRAITSILPPEGVAVPDIRSTMTKDYDIVVANGQGKFKDKIFRIGHLGFVSERDAITAIGALEGTLLKLGYKFESGSGLAALLKVFAE